MITWCALIAVVLSIFCIVYFFIYEPYFKSKNESVEKDFVNLMNGPAPMAISTQPGSSVFTITFWMCVNKTNTKRKRIITGVNNAGIEYFYLELGTAEKNYGDASLVMVVNPSGKEIVAPPEAPPEADESGDKSQLVTKTISHNFPLNKMVFVTLVFNGLKTAVYIDSKLYESINLPTTPPYDLTKIKLGGGESEFDCQIGYLTRYIAAWGEDKITSQYKTEHRKIMPYYTQFWNWITGGKKAPNDKYSTASSSAPASPVPPAPEHYGHNANPGGGLV